MSTTEAQDRSLNALAAFRERVGVLGLWTGAWLGIGAIRKDGQWLIYLFRLFLRAAGVRLPSPALAFDATTRDVLIRTRLLELSDCWAILADLAHEQTTALSRFVGEEVALFQEKHPVQWSFSPSPYLRNDRAHLHFSRGGSKVFHEVFGFELFERIAPQLRGHAPPYGSLRDVADGMGFFYAGNMDSNNAIAQFEVSAEIPVQLSECFYNPAQQGIEVGMVVGKDVPLRLVSLSLTPEPRVRRLGTDFEATLRDDVRLMKGLVLCDRPRVDVAVNVQYDDVHIASANIRSQERVTSGFAGVGRIEPTEQWEAILLREYHWSRQMLRRTLRATMPGRLAEVAEWRIAKSVQLRDEYPFFAVVSAASVAEVLLLERLGRVSPRVRSREWKSLRDEDRNLPRKLPGISNMKFDHAIRLGQRLGLLDGIEVRAIDLLREARNEIHLDRKSRLPKEDFSPVRASQALLATLDLARRLKTTVRARPTRRAVTSPDRA